MSVRNRKGKWEARISVNRRRIHLGTFASEAEARASYQKAYEVMSPERVTKPRLARDPAERFWSKTAIQDNGCIFWTAATDKDGYGKYQLNSGGRQRHVRAHRYAFFLATGRYPADLAIHSCDTPCCVNPDHLRDGSQSENQIDCAIRTRRKSIRLNEDLVRSVRFRHAGGESVTCIASDLGVPRGTLFSMIHGRTWGHVK